MRKDADVTACERSKVKKEIEFKTTYIRICLPRVTLAPAFCWEPIRVSRSDDDRTRVTRKVHRLHT